MELHALTQAARSYVLLYNMYRDGVPRYGEFLGNCMAFRLQSNTIPNDYSAPLQISRCGTKMLLQSHAQTPYLSHEEEGGLVAVEHIYAWFVLSQQSSFQAKQCNFMQALNATQ